MRIERVIAHAFGPLEEQTLEFAAGMTLVYGLNEAGKSSWHAALYAGLCGMRRGKGQPVIADREFRDDHKPWDDDRWDVEVLVSLADDRRIEIRQDLAGKVDSRATDVSIGKDVSDEIMFEGSPDGSLWLGLDRRAFLATACINQSQLLAVSDDPDALQEHIQRAAATRGTDATAAAALERLDGFRRAQVGEDRAHSTKPLRRAKVTLDEAWQDLLGAQQRHEAFLGLAAESEAALERAERATSDLRPAVAAVAAHRAQVARLAADRAAALAALHPDGAPTGLAENDELGHQVASALDAWARRPSPVALEGDDAETLGTELNLLPAQPVGDLDPSAEVLEAKAEYDRRLEARSLVGERPSAVVAPALTTGPVSDGPVIVPPVDRPVGTSRRARYLAGGAIGAALAGLVALTVLPPIAILAFILAGALGAAAFVDRGRSGGSTSWSPGSTAEAEAADRARLEATRVEATRQQASHEVEARLIEWSRLVEERTSALQGGQAALMDSLAAHGVVVERGSDPEAAFQRYLSDTRNRSTLAREAARAADLAERIRARLDLERSAAQVAQTSANIESELRSVARAIGVPGVSTTDPQTLAEGLRAWLENRFAELRSQEAAILEWRELQTLLGDRSVAELAAEAARLAELARERAVDLDPRQVAAAEQTLGPDPDRRIAHLEAEADANRAQADQLAGRLDEMERGLANVAEAEERLAAADAEVSRVTALDSVLQTTIALLRQAEERIHRDLAPVLNAAIAAQLPRISDGRYIEATVDPATLAVKVKAADGGYWREARRLSHGTREQIYLLLRLAMTQQLVRAGEISPLLCDEVTVQSDQRRATQLLGLLHDVSRDRQVIVFSHDERALAWAESALVAERDRIVRLPSP